jgi:probable HAF family extracellular repeat protein
MRTRLQYEVIPLAVDGVLHDLNNSGECVGHALSADGAMVAVRLTPRAEQIPLGTLGGSASSARAINASGAIVGGALTEDDESYHAFLFESGVMHDLNDLITSGSGWELIQALGINDKGDIVAIGHCGGEDRVVLLKCRIDPPAKQAKSEA